MEFENELKRQIERRKTFAIISHPDAGKTTMTEKLLLYGGAILMAGSVKARKAARHATSDWMEIEKQRGISVTSSVMQFDYEGFCINILDTPGHQDFSEDTYRTLMAADSAVMLIDGAKGVEPQTIKLFKVCKMRGIPIFTFVNKMDRASKDPFSLMEEIENVLGIRAYPINWPIGTEGDFKGIYDRSEKSVEIYQGGAHGSTKVDVLKGRLVEDNFTELLDEYHNNKLKDEIELLEVAGESFDRSLINSGNLTPMFFGSAMNNFGVEPFLKEFLKMAPAPLYREAVPHEIFPDNESFSGFIFKIQANMNPAHRDRIAFLRICSGRFTKGMEAVQTRTGKVIRLSQPQQFLAQERTIIDEAWPGDIIGLFDPGIFSIGDTLSEKIPDLKFEGMPTFPSEIFARIAPNDTMKKKQFQKGISQLVEEGAIQIFNQPLSGMEGVIAGVVGMLQLEVLEYRLKSEYGVDIRKNLMPHKSAMWIINENLDTEKLNLPSACILVEDQEQRKVLLFENEWSVRMTQDRNKRLELTSIKLQK